jgi:hypothetical protein
MCVQPSCMNYGKLLVVPLGKGEFHLNSILTNLKCEICPGKDKGINPPMAIKKFRFVDCAWRHEGHHPDKEGFDGLHYSKGWNKVENSDEHKFESLVKNQKWTDLKIYVRGL